MDQIWGEQIFKVNTTATKFWTDPICHECGDVPFHIEGDWAKGSEDIVFLDEIQMFFMPTRKH